MILLVDNYDSFSYNLYQLVGASAPDITVVRNDSLSVGEVKAMRPEAIILSPGPGRPADAGICVPLIREVAGRIPLLGVCLGHQAICEALGGKVDYAKELMHGKQRPIRRYGNSRLLSGLPEVFPAARYHSLAADEASLPAALSVTARSDDEEAEVMAVEDIERNIYGVQFHPESVMTPNGRQMVENFLYAARCAVREEKK